MADTETLDPHPSSDAARASWAGSAASAFEPLTLDEDWQLAPGESRFLRVCTGHYQVHCHLEPRPGARYLLVLFHGARDNGRDQSPLLTRPAWASHLAVHLLAISDPTAEARWPGALPRASMYIGTLAHPLAPELNALIDQAAQALGVAASHTVLYGPSSGGAAALLIGSLRPAGRVIASNAMTHFDSLPRKLVERAFDGLGCEAEAVDAARRQAPWRFDPASAWRHGLAQGHDLRLVISQSQGDLRTVSTHFRHLCETAGLAGERGGVSADGRALALLHDEPGHAGEPPARLIRAALASFDVAPSELPHTALPGLPAGCYDLASVQEEDTNEPLTWPPPRPLAPAAHSGVLLLSGPPLATTRLLRQVLMGDPALWVGLERFRWRARQAKGLNAALFTPERLQRFEVGDCAPPDRAGGVLVDPPADWQGLRWIGDSLQALYWRLPQTLSALPQARVVFLAVDAATTLYARGASRQSTPTDAATLRAQAVATLGEWRHQTRQMAQALALHGERIFVLSHEALLQDGEAALQPLLHWLSLQPTAVLRARLRRYREQFEQPAQSGWALSEPLAAMITPTDQAAWQSLLAHALRTVAD